MGALIYDKWGTHVDFDNEDDERLQSFIYEGSRATATGNGWEVLPGPVERRLDRVCGLTLYLWPVCREVA